MRQSRLATIKVAIPRCGNSKRRGPFLVIANRIRRSISGLSIALMLFTTPVNAQAIANQPYGGEDKDWGAAPQSLPKTDELHAPTPTTIPGGRVVTTYWLNGALEAPDPTVFDSDVTPSKPIVINVLDGISVRAIPGSVWLSRAGFGARFDDLTQDRLAKRLAELTQRNKAAQIVFYCLSSVCWLSYNATLRALRLGYLNAQWYRGGIEAWTDARLPYVVIVRDEW